jgi:hypothetical protein
MVPGYVAGGCKPERDCSSAVAAVLRSWGRVALYVLVPERNYGFREPKAQAIVRFICLDLRCNAVDGTLEESLQCMPQLYPPLQKTQEWGTLSVGATDKPDVQLFDPSKRETKDMRKSSGRVYENEEARIAALRKQLAKAQQLIRKHVSPKRSLADELIAERREAARHE